MHESDARIRGNGRTAVKTRDSDFVWEAQAASLRCSAACRKKIFVGRLPTDAGKLPALPGRNWRPENSVLFDENA